MYAEGKGVRQNYHRAAEWFAVAADPGGHRDAQFALGQMYLNGRGLPHDYARAFEWFRKAAQGGHPIAQYLMGAMYEEGWGVKRDFREAYVWYSLVLSKAEETMAFNKKYDPAAKRKTVIDRMNRAQLREAQRRLAARQSSR